MEWYDIVSILMCIFLVFMIGMLISDINSDVHIEDLGNSICEEEYEMEFDYYDKSSKKLYCKISEVIEQYDGIIVSLKKEID